MEDIKEVKKQAEQNIIEKVLENRFANMVMFGGVLAGVIFWVTMPQRALENKVAVLEEKILSGNALQSQLQNIKDNDLHEIQRQITEQRKVLDDLRVQTGHLETKIDILLKRQ